jgi:ADP-heptose:LPS heptosyltransferase
LNLISNITNKNYPQEQNFLPIFNIDIKNTHFSKKLLKENYLIIAPFGGKNKFSEMPTRCWPYFQELFIKIEQELPQYKIYLTGSKEEQKAMAKLISQDCKKIINLAGKLNFDELGLLLKNAKLFLGNDSFPLFMAVSQNIPIIGLFGPTDAKKIIAQYPKARFIQGKTKCSPCYNPILATKSLAYHCPYSAECMKSIKVNDVLKLLRGILGDKIKFNSKI